MYSVFQLVENLLLRIAFITGLSYNEINIIVYYIVIPFTWVALIDKILKIHYLKIIFGIGVIITIISIKDFSKFCDWLFLKSVVFLKFFGDYVNSSVVICVFLVVFIYLLLIYLAFFHKTDLISKILDLDEVKVDGN